MWVAPGLCVIAEFALRRGEPLWLGWYRQLEFTGLDQLGALLASVTRKRWLQGRAMSVCLSTPDVFATSAFDPDTPAEKQNLLAPGLEWENVEYAVSRPTRPLFACIRSVDIDRWHDLMESAGLVLNAVLPAGPMWGQLFDARGGEIVCALPSGVLHRWESGTLYVPNTQETPPGSDAGGRFDAKAANSFEWCPAAALPALEAVISAERRPTFNLNPHAFEAAAILRAESFIWRALRYATAGLCALVCLAALAGAGAGAWNGLLGRQRNDQRRLVQETGRIRKATREAGERIKNYRSLLAQRSNAAKALYELAGLGRDSLWFSEMQVERNKSYEIAVIGHALSEAEVSRMFEAAESTPGAGKVGLEYTERLSPGEVGKLTKWKRKCTLYRFKLVLVMSGM